MLLVRGARLSFDRRLSQKGRAMELKQGQELRVRIADSVEELNEFIITVSPRQEEGYFLMIRQAAPNEGMVARLLNDASNPLDGVAELYGNAIEIQGMASVDFGWVPYSSDPQR